MILSVRKKIINISVMNFLPWDSLDEGACIEKMKNPEISIKKT